MSTFDVGIGVSIHGKNTIPAFIDDLGDLAKQQDKVKLSFNETRNGVTKLVAEYNNLTKAEEKVVKTAVKKAGADAKYIKSVKDLEKALNKLETATNASDKATESSTDSTKNQEKATENLTEAVKEHEKASEEDTEARKKNKKASQEQQAESKRKEKADRRAAEEVRRYAAAEEHLRKKIEAVTEAINARGRRARNFQFQIQDKVQQTSGAQAANRQSVIANQLAASQTRHNNSILRIQQSHQLQMQRMTANHQNVLQRIAASNRNGGGMFGGRGSMGTGAGFVGNVNSLPGVGKVIAYDALRRILTNIYQTVGKVGDEIVEWTKSSILFNDEMERSKIVFKGLGLIGQKNKDGSAMSVKDAQNNPQMQQVFGKVNQFSEDMMARLVAVSANTGQSMEEIIASARQMMPDLLNKRKMKDGTSPLLGKGGEDFANVTEAMVQLAAVLKMSDPGGRALKWHMVAIQELFSGSSGNSQDKGMANVKSMMLREGIKIREDEAAPIAKAVNEGDVTKAGELIQQVLERSGQGIVTFSNLLEYTLMPNIDAIKTAFAFLSAQMNNPLYQQLVVMFSNYRKIMLNLMKDKSFLQLMESYGKQFRNAFRPFITPLNDFFQQIRDTKGDSLKPYLDTFMSVTKNFNIIFANFITGVVGFFKGLFGVNSKEGFDTEPILNFTKQFAESGETFGLQMRNFGDAVLKGIDPLLNNFFPAMETLGNIFILLASFIDPFIRVLAAVGREILNLPLVGNLINATRGKEDADEMRRQLNAFVTDGGKGTGEIDGAGFAAETIVSPAKLVNILGGMMPKMFWGLENNAENSFLENNPDGGWVTDGTVGMLRNRIYGYNPWTNKDYDNNSVTGQAPEVVALEAHKKTQDILKGNGLVGEDFKYTPEFLKMAARASAGTPTIQDVKVQYEIEQIKKEADEKIKRLNENKPSSPQEPSKAPTLESVRNEIKSERIKLEETKKRRAQERSANEASKVPQVSYDKGNNASKAGQKPIPAAPKAPTSTPAVPGPRVTVVTPPQGGKPSVTVEAPKPSAMPGSPKGVKSVKTVEQINAGIEQLGPPKPSSVVVIPPMPTPVKNVPEMPKGEFIQRNMATSMPTNIPATMNAPTPMQALDYVLRGIRSTFGQTAPKKPENDFSGFQQRQPINYPKVNVPSPVGVGVSPAQAAKPVQASKGVSEKEFIAIATKIVTDKIRTTKEPIVIRPGGGINMTSNVIVHNLTVKTDNPNKFVEDLKAMKPQTSSNQTMIPATFLPGRGGS